MGFTNDLASAMSGLFTKWTGGTSKPGANPPIGEQSGPQNVGSGPLGFFNGPVGNELYGIAGGTNIPGYYPGLFAGMPGGQLGVPVQFGGGLFGWNGTGWIQPRKGTYTTYRLMDLEPTIRVTWSLITQPIMASQWTARITPGFEEKKLKTGKTKDNILELIQDQIIPMREWLLPECLRYLRTGWRPFERVYEIQDEMYVLTKMKPLLPDFTAILHDGKGNFQGISGAGGIDNTALMPNKCWICTCDGEAGNLYGLPRHEAAYDAWLDKYSARIRAALTSGKLSGILPTLYYRPGITPLNGKPTNNSDIAKQILATVGSGNGVAVPTTQYTDEELQSNPELAAMSPWKLEIMNAGTYAPAIEGMIKEREYQDKLMVRAWGWPERSVLEAQKSGSRADSQTHSDSASADREAIDDDIARQISRGDPMHDVPGIVDELVALNFGEDCRGVFEISPAPLVDAKVQVYTKLLSAVFTNTALAPIFANVVDWDAMLDHLDIAMVDDVDEKLIPALKRASDIAAGITVLTPDTVGAANAAASSPGAGPGKTAKVPKPNGRPMLGAKKVLSRLLDTYNDTNGEN